MPSSVGFQEPGPSASLDDDVCRQLSKDVGRVYMLATLCVHVRLFTQDKHKANVEKSELIVIAYPSSPVKGGEHGIGAV